MKPYIAGYTVKVGEKVTKSWSRLFNLYRCSNMIFRFSTSIQNFADRVMNHHNVEPWKFPNTLFKPTVFLGLYHEGDWIRFLIHRGPKIAFWCGGDILRLKRKPFWQWIVKRTFGRHVCENGVEQDALANMGILSDIHPILFFDDWTKYPLSFRPSKKPHVWLTCHPGREREYGVDFVEEIAQEVPEVTFHIFGIKKPFHEPWFDPVNGELMNYRFMFNKNIIYHGHVPSEELDEMIQDYHAGLRICEFDGCPHVVTKGALLGQYPISRIPYPHVDSYETKEELIKLLKNLKNKTKPNLEGRSYWAEMVSNFPWQ